MRTTLLSAALLLAATACVTDEQSDLAFVEVAFVEARAGNTDFDMGEIGFHFRITNPNLRSIAVDSLDWTLNIEDVEMASGTVDEPMDLGPLEGELPVVPVMLDWEAARTGELGVNSREPGIGTFPASLDLRVNWVADGETQDAVAIVAETDVEVPRPPKLWVQGVDLVFVDRAEDTARVVLQVGAENPNADILFFDRLDWRFEVRRDEADAFEQAGSAYQASLGGIPGGFSSGQTDADGEPVPFFTVPAVIEMAPLGGWENLFHDKTFEVRLLGSYFVDNPWGAPIAGELLPETYEIRIECGDQATVYLDLDGDGYGVEAESGQLCAPNAQWSDVYGDCDDADSSVNPEAEESCDGVDNNCADGVDESGATDETPWYLDADGDGFGDDEVEQWACDAPPDYVADDTDCDDTLAQRNPDATETCDGADNDCDGQLPADEFDLDGDGYFECDGDCDDDNEDIRPFILDDCNGIDDNCDGSIDENADADTPTRICRNGWWEFDAQNTSDSTGDFGVVPDGSGATGIRVELGSGSSKGSWWTDVHNGVRLDEITTIEYTTWRAQPLGTKCWQPSLQFAFDRDVTDGHDVDGWMVYETYYSPGFCSDSETWFTWDPTGDRRWWWGSPPSDVIAPECNISNPCSWDKWVSDYPDGGIQAAGRIHFKAGSGWNGFEGYVGELVFGVNGVDTVHDF